MSCPDNKKVEEQYPELADYLAIFDHESCVTYPPVAGPQKTCSSQNVEKKKLNKNSILQAALILLLAAVIVLIAFMIGINALPGLQQ